ncbi:MAG: U32 family peptidase, partial [Clostridia bacterium]|nr:U32 family peptidase [Clostridia bacterium]
VGRLNARAKAQNFTIENIREHIDFAHLFGVKVYITFNTVLTDGEYPELYDTAKAAYLANADAFIVQDHAVARFLHTHFPLIPIHASTQMGIHNAQGAHFVKELGFSRVILSRESRLEDIRQIASVMPTEVFIQGALCVAFSGNCYFSSVAFSESGNRGRCLQPCRKKYTSSLGNKCGNYLLSTSDLCLEKQIGVLTEAGVCSFKIEGRMRRPEYVAACVRFYRKLLDGKTITPKDREALASMFNRGNYTKGYLYGADTHELMSPVLQNHRGVVIGKISSVSKRSFTVKTDKQLLKEDGFKILSVNGEEKGGASFIERSNESTACFSSEMHASVKAGDVICRTTDAALIKELQNFDCKIPIEIDVEFYADTPMILRGRFADGSSDAQISVENEQKVLSAQEHPITKQVLFKQLNKLGNAPFVLQSLNVFTDEKGFLPLSVINATRRELVQKMIDFRLSTYQDRSFSVVSMSQASHAQNEDGGCFDCVIVDEDTRSLARHFKTVIYKPHSYSKNDLSEILPYCNEDSELYLYLPVFFTQKEGEALLSKVSELSYSGIYATNASQISWAKQFGLRVICGAECNTISRATRDCLLSMGAQRVVLSYECSYKYASELCGARTLLPIYASQTLMHLHHCPVQNATGCTCADCKYNGKPIALRDENGFVFNVIRRRIDGRCYFELKNSIPLFALPKLNCRLSCLLDFSDCDKDKAEAVYRAFDAYINGKPYDKQQFETFRPFTYGNLFRTV